MSRGNNASAASRLRGLGACTGAAQDRLHLILQLKFALLQRYFFDLFGF
jgi:hypothetical protein